MLQTEQEILDCAAMTREIASIAWSIEQDTLPTLRGAHVHSMERIFAVIDNFNDIVLPRVSKDVSQLEALVDKLEALHEAQASPVTSFFSGILRGGAGSAQAGGGVGALEAQRAKIKLHSKDELLELLYSGDIISPSAGGGDEEEEGEEEEEEEEGPKGRGESANAANS
jgi:hypothetical protein